MKHTLIKLFSCALLAFGLSACQTAPTGSALHDGTNLPEPEVRLPDYLATDCQNVWKIETPAAMSNPFTGSVLSTAVSDYRLRKRGLKRVAGRFKVGRVLLNKEFCWQMAM